MMAIIELVIGYIYVMLFVDIIEQKLLHIGYKKSALPISDARQHVALQAYFCPMS